MSIRSHSCVLPSLFLSALFLFSCGERPEGRDLTAVDLSEPGKSAEESELCLPQTHVIDDFDGVRASSHNGWQVSYSCPRPPREPRSSIPQPPAATSTAPFISALKLSVDTSRAWLEFRSLPNEKIRLQLGTGNRPLENTIVDQTVTSKSYDSKIQLHDLTPDRALLACESYWYRLTISGMAEIPRRCGVTSSSSSASKVSTAPCPDTSQKIIVWTTLVKEEGGFQTLPVKITDLDASDEYPSTTARISIQTNGPAQVEVSVTDLKPQGETQHYSVTSSAYHFEHIEFPITSPEYLITASTDRCGSSATTRLSYDEWPQQPMSPVPYGIDYPRNMMPSWSNGFIQGVAHTDSHWYFSNSHFIMKIPVDHDVQTSADYPTFWLNRRYYDHIGDIDIANNFIYVPVEDNGGGGNRPKIVFLDANMNPIGEGQLTLPTSDRVESAPWVAVNPVDGLLYTSNFNIQNSYGQRLRAYRIHKSTSGAPISLSFEKEITLRNARGEPTTVNHVQGGVFSQMGHLYLVTDDDRPGVHGFNIKSGYDQGSEKLFFEVARANDQELEGIDIWDRDDGISPHITGQIHVLMGWDRSKFNGWFSRALWFKHYHVNPAELHKL